VVMTYICAPKEKALCTCQLVSGINLHVSIGLWYVCGLIKYASSMHQIVHNAVSSLILEVPCLPEWSVYNSMA
jgi:hypothetical protein